MKIDFLTKKHELTDAFRSFSEKRLNKFRKYLDDDVEVRVNLEELRSSHRVELLVHDHGDVLRAQSEGLDMRQAFMDAFHKLDVQLEKKKKKLKGRKRRKAHRMENQWQMNVIQRNVTPQEKSSPRVVKTTRLDVQAMTMEDALALMEQSNDEFIVFRDVEGGEVCFLHRRKDDNYNLIIPE